MKIEQIIVILENKADRLLEAINLLAQSCINIRALSLSDDRDRRILLRLIVNDRGKAKNILNEHGFTLTASEVLVIEVPDKPGGLASVLERLQGSDLEIEYMYAFSQKSGESGLLIFRFNDPDKAVQLLSKTGVRILSEEELYAL